MFPTGKDSLRLFRLWGISVHLHWSWFVVAIYSISIRVPNYTNPVWGALEYLALFLIVLMHEFGHSLACRQVGGTSDQIVLWPLGGVAYVAPPARPGANLWSIAAGPLVNVALMPIILGIFYLCGLAGLFTDNRDFYVFLQSVIYVNLILLVFNLLPIYPMDGGQIVRSLLWYPLGKARSLLVATVVGFIGGLGLVGLAIRLESIWMGIMTLFLLSNCWQSFKSAQTLRKIEKLPRRAEFSCPACHTSPPSGNYWLCPSCRHGFDPFATDARCPHCSNQLDLTLCPDCGTARAHRSWDTNIHDV